LAALVHAGVAQVATALGHGKGQRLDDDGNRKNED
jgi:hypothetical protein